MSGGARPDNLTTESSIPLGGFSRRTLEEDIKDKIFFFEYK